MSEDLVRATMFAVVLAVAALAGIAVTIGSMLLGHEILVLVYAEDLAPVDDTLLMIAAVSTSYLVGVVSGLLVLVLGWRRFVRRPRTVADPR